METPSYLRQLPSHEYRKVLFYVDQINMLDDRIIQVKDHIAEEFKKLGVSVTTDEGDKGSKLGVIFLTKEFLARRVGDLKLIKLRFARCRRCFVIVCNNEDGEFLKTMRSCIENGGLNDQQDPDDRFNKSLVLVRHLIGYSRQKCYYVDPGVSPCSAAEIQAFAKDFVDDAVRVFNHGNLDFNKLDPLFAVDFEATYVDLATSLNQIPEKNSDDVLFAVFNGCFCSCFDMNAIAKYTGILSFIYPYQFTASFPILKKKYLHCIDDDPLALAKAFLHMFLGDERHHLSSYFQMGHNQSKYCVVLEDFNFSSQLALLQLKNLAQMLGRGSLIVITTITFSGVINQVSHDMKPLRGADCRKTGLPLKCYTFFKSKMLQQAEDDIYMTLRKGFDKKATENVPIDTTSNGESVFEGAQKKHKITLVNLSSFEICELGSTV